MATYRIRPVLAVIKKTSVIAFIKKRNYTCVSHKVWEACLLGPKVPRFIPSTCPKGSCRIWNLEFPPEISENQLKLHKFKAIFKFLGCKCFARVLLPSFPALDSYFYWGIHFLLTTKFINFGCFSVFMYVMHVLLLWAAYVKRDLILSWLNIKLEIIQSMLCNNHPNHTYSVPFNSL